MAKHGYVDGNVSIAMSMVNMGLILFGMILVNLLVGEFKCDNTLFLIHMD